MQDNMSSLLQSVGACEKVLQLMHRSPSSQYLSKGLKFQELTGCIEFANVSFHYSSRNMIYINGIPLKEMDISWLREKIGFVVQDPHIFRGDVKSNISYGCFRSIRRGDMFCCKGKSSIAIARAILRDP